MSTSARQWIDDMIFGLRMLFERARTPEEIDLSVSAVEEVWRLEREVA